jgi:hypothetical protein
MTPLLVAAAGALATATPPPISVPVVKVAEVKSDKSCDLLAASWRWVLIECDQQFPKLRTALQSALLDSRKVRLSTQSNGRDVVRPDLIVSASVTGLGSSTERASGRDYCLASNKLEGRLDYRVRRASGEVLYGGSVEKTVEVASDAVAGSSSCGVGASDPGNYEQLEREIALTAARAILFRIAPLRVMDSSEDGIALNYGAPYLRLGDAVDVDGDHGERLRFRVSSSNGSSAFATPDGHHVRVPVSAAVTYVEQDDAANNARRFQKTELP